MGDDTTYRAFFVPLSPWAAPFCQSSPRRERYSALIPFLGRLPRPAPVFRLYRRHEGRQHAEGAELNGAPRAYSVQASSRFHVHAWWILQRWVAFVYACRSRPGRNKLRPHGENMGPFLRRGCFVICRRKLSLASTRRRLSEF